MHRKLSLWLVSIVLLTLPFFRSPASASPRKQVAPGFEFSPERLDFGRVPWGANNVQLLILTLDKARFNADRLPPIASDIGATITQFSRTEDVRHVILIYEVTLPSEPGAYSGIITFVGPAYGPDPADTRDIPLEGKGVDVVGEIVPGVAIFPQQVDLGKVTQGTFGKGQVTLCTPRGSTVAKGPGGYGRADVETDSPYLSARYTLGMGSLEGFGATYAVTLDPKTPPMTLTAHLTFRTAGGQVITVPVFAEVTAAKPQAAP